MYRPIDELAEEYKQDELQQAVERNQTKLAEANKTPPAKSPYQATNESLAQMQADIDANNKANEQQWRQSYERGTVLGQAQNLGAQALDFVSTLVTGIPELGVNALGHMQRFVVEDDAKKIFDRKQAYNAAVTDGTLEAKQKAVNTLRAQIDAKRLTGELKGEELDTAITQLNNLQSMYTPITADEQAILDRGISSTNEEQLLRAGGLFAAGDAIDKFQNEYFDYTDQKPANELGSQIADDFNATGAEKRQQGKELMDKGFLLEGAGQYIDGLWDGLGTVPGAVYDNPLAAVDLTMDVAVEALAYLKGKGLGKTAGVVDSAVAADEAVTEGIKEFREREGRDPNSDELAGILASGALYGGADFLSLKIAADAIKKTGKKLPESAPETETPKGPTGLLDTTVERTAKLTGATAGEAGTGFVQGALEETTLQGNTDLDKVDGGEVVASTVMEALGVAGLSGVRQGTGQAVDTVKAGGKVLKNLGGEQLSRDQQARSPEERETAAKEVDAALESGNISTILDDNSDKFDVLTKLDTISRRNATEGVSQDEKDENMNQATTLVQSVASELTALEEEAQALNGKKDNKSQARIKELKKELPKAQARFDEAVTYVQQIQAASVQSQEEVATLKEAVESATEVTEDSVSQGDKIISLTQRAPQMVPPEDARKLAQSKGLEQTQRDYLEAFANAQEVINEAKDTDMVSRDVFIGGQGFRGIDQYRSTLPALLATGRTESAAALVSQLQKFASGKIERAAAFSKLLDARLNPDITPEQARAAQAEFDSKGYVDQRGNASFVPARPSQRAINMIRAQEMEAQALQAVVAESVALLGNSVRNGSITPEVATTLQPTVDTTAAAVEDTPPWDTTETEAAATAPVQNVAQPPVQDAPPADYADYEAMNQTEDETAATVEPTPAQPEQDAPSMKSDERIALEQEEYQLNQDLFDTEVDPEVRVAMEQRLIDVRERMAEMDQEVQQQTQQIEEDSPPRDEAPPEEAVDVPEPEAATNDSETVSPETIAPTTEIIAKKTASIVTTAQNLATGLVSSIAMKLKRDAMVVRQSKEEPGILQSVDFQDFFADVPEGDPLRALYELHEQELAPMFDQMFNADHELLGLLAFEDGTVDENVKAAFSIAAFNWLSTMASNTLYNDNQAIGNLLHMGRDAYITPKLRELMIDKGSTPHVLAEALGRDVLRILSIRFSDKEYSNKQKNLEIAAGGLLLNMLAGTQYVTVDNVVGQDILSRMTPRQQEESTLDPKANLRFVRLRAGTTQRKGNNQDRFRPHEKVLSLINRAKVANPSVSDLFGAERLQTKPTFEPVKEIVQKMRRTNQRIPKKMRDVIKKAQERGYTLKKAEGVVLDFLPEDLVKQIFGFNVNVNNTVHVDNIKSEQAKNLAAEKSLEYYRGLKDEGGEDKPFYFRFFVARQGRLHLDSNTFNPQGDKAHRFLFTSPDFESTVALDPNDISNVRFRVAVAEAFGIKVDQLTDEDALAQLDAMIEAKPEIEAAALALVKIANGEGTDADKAAVAAGLKATEMNTHGLSALMNYGKMLTAEGEFFTSDLVAEVDGKTNGPAIGILQFAAWASDAVLRKFGVFTNGETSYGEWYKQPESYDAYQEMAVAWGKNLREDKLRERIQNMMGNKRISAKRRAELGKRMNQFSVLKSIIGEFVIEDDGGISVVTKDGRNMSKNPTMITVYGASGRKVAENIGEAAVDVLRSRIEKANAIEDAVERNNALMAIAVQMDQLMGKNQNIMGWGQQRMDATTGNRYWDFSKALSTTIPAEVEQELIKAVQDTYGVAVIDAIGETYGDFTEKRDQFNATIQQTNDIFVAVYKARVQKAIETQMEIDPEFDPEKDMLPRELLNEIERKLTAIMPIMRQPLQTKKEGNSHGIFLGRKDSTRDTSNPASAVKLPGSANVKVLNATGSLTNNMPMTYTSAIEDYSTDIGVGPAIMSIHNVDATVAMDMLSEHNLLSVFDGFLGATNSITEISRTGNASFFKTSAGQSLLRNAAEQLRVTRVIAARMNEAEDLGLTIPPEDVQPLVNSLVNEAEAKRTNLFNRITGILQYNREGGVYKPDEEVAAPDALPEQEVVSSQAAAEEAAAADVEEAKAEVAEQTRTSKWGRLGRDAWWYNNYPVERAIEKLFEDADEVPAEMVLEKLTTVLRYKNRKAHAQGMGAMAEQVLNSLAGRDIKIRIMRPETQIPEGLQPAKEWDGNFTAYYTNANGERVIYLKSTDFEVHGLNATTVMHELVHAATMDAIDDPQTDAQREAMFQLNQLMEYLRPSLGKDYPAAFDNLAEFVAWGMTDRNFQGALYYSKLGDSFAGTLKTAFNVFVDAVMKALGIEGKHERALSQVLAYSSDLFIDADQEFSLKPQQSPQKVYTEYDNVDLFNDLANRDGRQLNEAEQTRLRSIVQSFSKHINLFEGYVADAKQELSDVTDLYLDGLVNNRVPFVSRLRATNLRLTKQELYVAEQVEAITRGGLSTSIRANKELRRLFMKAKAQMPLSAFADDPSLDLTLPANAQARAVAQARRDSVFKVDATNEQGRSDYLARFLALSVAHKPFRDALSRIQPEPQYDAQSATLSQHLDHYFNKLMDAISQVLRLPKRPAHMQKAMDQMFQELADSRIREQSHAMQVAMQKMEQFEGVANGVAKAVRETVAKVARADMITNSKYAVVRAAGTTVNAVVKDQVTDIIEGLEEIAEPYLKGKQGTLGALVTEFKGMTEGNTRFYELLRIAKHRIDQARKHVEIYTSKAVKNAFGRELTEAESEALTKVLIKGDLQALTDHYELNEIADMLSDPSKLEAEIDRLRNRMRSTGKWSMRFRQDARELGYFLATGEATGDMPYQNAHNIARQAGRGVVVDGDTRAKAEPIIDRLASLWAMHYTDTGHRNRVAQLIREESQRESGENGVQFVLNQHRALIEMSKRDLFEKGPAMMIKGYSKDTTDPHVSVRVVDDLSEKELTQRGYQVVRTMGRDSADLVNSKTYLVVSDSDGLDTHVTGIMSLTARKTKGNHLEWLSKRDVQAITARKRAKLNMNPAGEIDPAKQKGAKMVPVIREDGAIVSYRYMMNEADRDSLLKRDNDISKVMGVYAASIVDKRESVDVNRDTVKALHEEFKAGQDRLGRFVAISKDSKDPKIAQEWNLLPEETKQAARDIFGGDFIYVPRDMQNMVMGYRKVGLLTGLWDVPEEDRGAIRSLIIDMLEHTPFLGKDALAKIRRNGEIWDEMIRGVKDIFVIRSGITLLGNIVSNFSVLWLAGVSLGDMVELHRDGYNGIVAYQKDTEELEILRQQLKGNKHVTRAKRTEMEERIAELEDALAVNPVRELAEAGAFTTIIEDIDDMPDDFSYRNRLENWLDERTSKVPQGIKTAADYAVIGKKTPVYQFLNHTTQVSDFVARYVMYKHLTERKAEPVAKRDAVNRVMETFIMYDVPSDKWIQWANDKGVLMFTKYFIRVQKIIYQLMRENPSRTLSLMGMNQLFDFWDVLESSFLAGGLGHRVSNPVTMMMEAPADIATFKFANDLL